MNNGQSYYVGLNADHDGSEVTEIVNRTEFHKDHTEYVFEVLCGKRTLAWIINFPVVVKYEDK